MLVSGLTPYRALILSARFTIIKFISANVAIALTQLRLLMPVAAAISLLGIAVNF